ncbi:MAG TPA: cation diffusion facilitator family transporter [Burkholderiales bacterium]|nr:cation diffusion facilitator family transporter [Burkholderiales bacterium]
MSRRALTRYAWLSVGAAIVTIALKTAAWWFTDSVGLLSDALESLVNLAAALLTLCMLTLAARPPDERHAYGYSKAEYLSGGIEGALILLAAILIMYAATLRFISPQPILRIDVGVVVSILASIVNFVVARVLHRAAATHRSMALEADSRHLMTDVWTSAGVLIAVVAVYFTGWWRLDPIIAFIVGAHIIWTGVQLIGKAGRGLLDYAMPPEERALIEEILRSYEAHGVRYHALMTRQAAGHSFVTVHVLTPGEWTVQRGHDLVEEIETRIRTAIPHTSVLTHLEPIGDPVSYQDIEPFR